MSLNDFEVLKRLGKSIHFQKSTAPDFLLSMSREKPAEPQFNPFFSALASESRISSLFLIDSNCFAV